MARLDVENLLGLGIERRQRAHGAEQDSHGMGIMMKTVDKFFNVFMNDRVVRDVVRPVFKLRFVRQLAVEYQISGF